MVIGAIVMGALAWCFVNVDALLPRYVVRERYLKAARTPGAVEVDAPDEFIDRVRSRDRRGMVVSAVAVGLAVVAFAVVGGLDPYVFWPGCLFAALVSRAIALAVIAGGEALRDRGQGVRVSRGEVRRLSDYLVVWAFAVMFVAQALWLPGYFIAASALDLGGRGWSWTIGLLSVVMSVAAVVLAGWLARQPQRASDGASLYWDDLVRQRDLSALLAIGPMLSITVAFQPLGVRSLRVLVLFGYFAVLAGIWAVASLLSKRRFRARLWPHGVTS